MSTFNRATENTRAADRSTIRRQVAVEICNLMHVIAVLPNAPVRGQTCTDEGRGSCSHTGVLRRTNNTAGQLNVYSISPFTTSANYVPMRTEYSARSNLGAAIQGLVAASGVVKICFGV